MGGNKGYAHRLSYELHHGPIPPGMFVMHSCDNPPCTNPDHLSLGTHEDNMADARRKGRMTAGTARPAAKLTDAKAVEIFRRRHAGEPIRRLAAEFGVTDSVVVRIAQRRCWARATAAAAAELEAAV